MGAIHTTWIKEKMYAWLNGGVQTAWMGERKVQLVERGAIHTTWIKERKVQLDEWGTYTQHEWKGERYGWLNGGRTHYIDGREKGTVG